MRRDAPEMEVGGRESAAPVWVADIPLSFALAVQTVCAAIAVCEVLASCFFCMSRPVVEHNGYTCFHLPGLNLKPDEPRKDDAIFAILAARIAFSSFDIRSRLR